MALPPMAIKCSFINPFAFATKIQNRSSISLSLKPKLSEKVNSPI
jgi:hypothetical protein